MNPHFVDAVQLRTPIKIEGCEAQPNEWFVVKDDGHQLIMTDEHFRKMYRLVDQPGGGGKVYRTSET
jgi:hypothetical protein